MLLFLCARGDAGTPAAPSLFSDFLVACLSFSLLLLSQTGGCGREDKSPDIKTASGATQAEPLSVLAPMQSWFMGCNVMDGQEMLGAS